MDAIRELLPAGDLLGDRVWARRHRVVIAVAFAQSLCLFAFALSRGFGVVHSAADALPVALLAAFGCWGHLSRKLRSVAGSLALISAAALLTHVWQGQIEAHFAFFVNLGLLTIYQDWLPFGIAIAYVLFHHGVLGVISPSSVYSHADGRAHPWKWAAIHTGFVFAATAANLVCWRMSEQALREPLTGLPGRALLFQRLTRLRDPHRRQSLAVLFIDLDDFKVLNDSRGHGAGDELLVKVAERLRAGVRPQDTVARMGGDEFAVICPGITTAPAALEIAQRLRDDVARSYTVRGERVSTKASVGIVVARGAEDAERLLAEADLAMYAAKARGGNGCALFDDRLNARALERHQLEGGLRGALERKETETWYQPIVRLADGAPIGVEALARWTHPELGCVSPVRFVEVAEASGLIHALGGQTLARACTDVARFNHAHPGLPDRQVAVNLSGRQLADPDLSVTVAEALQASGLQPSKLCLEVTESVLFASGNPRQELFGPLKELGVQLALDDFGTGYSSLGYLKQLPFDVLKIDRSFISNLADSPTDQAIVQAVLTMAETLGITVIAEGVETPAQASHLRALGCELAQGFLYSPAIAPEQLHTILADAPQIAQAG
jgi:diguanylate cyclase (GGDEF)-like protein